MALREFHDSQGTRWLAFDVRPDKVYSPVRSGADRRALQPAPYQGEQRRGKDRRTRPFHPMTAYGWICFQSESEKRRLTPAPENWESFPADQLESLCRRSEPAR
jgi:hypothetical protein